MRNSCAKAKVRAGAGVRKERKGLEGQDEQEVEREEEQEEEQEEEEEQGVVLAPETNF